MHHRQLVLRLAALLLLVVAGGQSRPAAPASQPAASQAALEREFLARKSALKLGGADDLDARTELARWAREHELWTQAADLAREVLARDPDNRSAWTTLQFVDRSVILPAEPDNEEALKKEFNKRFDRDRPDSIPFKTRNSRHFLLCYDTTDAFASKLGGSLEKVYDSFMFVFNMSRLRPAFLSRRLVVILFKNRADYLAYARETEGANLAWAAGYYSQRTNRTAFYDDSTGLEAESVEKQLDKLRKRLKDLNAEIDAAKDKNNHALVAVLSDERHRIAEFLAQANLKVDNSLILMNAVKTAHEAAHQLAFNMGVQRRLVDYPLWFSEGLACCFEMEDRTGRRGPAIVNYGRLAVLKEALKRENHGDRPGGSGGGANRGGLIPLEQFVSQPTPLVMDENTMNIFYAEGWALFHYLYKFHRDGMESYLLAYQKLPPIAAVPGEKRLQLFTDAFGEDLPALQKKFTTYLKDLPAKAP